jgi:hypothetical protein
MLPMRSTTVSMQAATTRPAKRPADATARAVSTSEGTSIAPQLADLADLIGSVDDDLPADLSLRTKHYLRLWGYGRNRSAQARQQR